MIETRTVVVCTGSTAGVLMLGMYVHEEAAYHAECVVEALEPRRG